MSSNLQFLNQLRQSPPPQNNHSLYQKDKSVASSMKSFSLLSNKKQLKDLIIAKFQQDFRNEEYKLEKAIEIVDQFFKEEQKLSEQSIRDLKGKVHQAVFNMKKPKDYKPQENSYKPVSARDNSEKNVKVNHTVSQSKQNYNLSQQNLVQLSQNSDLKLPPIDQKNDKKNHKNKILQMNLNNSAEGPNLINQYELTAQNLQNLNNKKMEQAINKQKQIELMERDSPRSVYEGEKGDEYALIVKAEHKRYLKEQEEKKKKKQEEKQRMKEDLDQMVQNKQSRKQEDLEREVNIAVRLTNEQIDKQEQRKRLEDLQQKRKEHDQREMRLQQLNELQKQKRNMREEDLYLQREITKKSQKELEEDQQRELQKKQRERDFYEKVKQEQEEWKYNSLVNQQEPNFYKKNNSIDDFASVFEKNKKLRENQQKKIQQKQDKIQEPVVRQLLQTGQRMTLDGENKQEILERFRQQELRQKQLDYEEQQRKEELKRQLQDSYAKMIELKNQEKIREKEIDKKQAQIWTQDNDQFQRENQFKEHQFKNKNQEVQQFLKAQIQEQNNTKQSPVAQVKMNNEELLLNKKYIKEILQENGQTVQKKETSNFRHVPKKNNIVK